MATVKVHKLMRGKVGDPTALRTLCGRSSFTVWEVETVSPGANSTATDADVTCKFCQRLLPALAKKETA